MTDDAVERLRRYYIFFGMEIERVKMAKGLEVIAKFVAPDDISLQNSLMKLFESVEEDYRRLGVSIPERENVIRDIDILFGKGTSH